MGFLFSSNIVDFVQQKSVTCKQQMDIDDKKKSPTSLVLSRKTTKNEIIEQEKTFRKQPLYSIQTTQKIMAPSPPTPANDQSGSLTLTLY